MRALNRKLLSLVLAIALIAGGAPFAHSMPSEAVAGEHAPIVHSVTDHAVDVMADHTMHCDEMHHADVAAEHDHAQSDSSAAALNNLLKGHKCCSICATAYIDPAQRIASVELVSFTVRYYLPAVLGPNELTFADPEIPIV